MDGRRLCFVGLVLVLLAASGEANRNPSNAAGRGRLNKPVQEIKKGGQRTLFNKWPTKRPSSNKPDLVTVKVANVVTFDLGDDKLEQELLNNGSYNPKSIEPYHVIEDISSRNRLFVTTPMVKPGIPASLSTVPYDGSANFSLKPYPSLDLHRTTVDTITDCANQLVSITPITKTWTDDGKLYAIDSGVLNILTSPEHVCAPKIVIFDLRTDEIVNRITIENAACNSLYTVIWVDPSPTGGLLAYSADPFGFRMTVTDLTTGVSKHLQSQYFFPKPGFFFTKAGGPPTYLAFGLAGIAADNSSDGKVYFQALATNIQGVLDKQVIRDASDGQVMDSTAQVALPGLLPGTSGPMVVNPKGELLFFPIQDELAIYVWNTSKPHHPDNFCLVVRDKERMQYVANMQIDPTSGLLWMLTDRFPSFVSNTIDYSDDNYYIMYISIKGIVC